MKKKTGQGEEGFVLVWALLLIVVLVLLGTFGISTSIFESKMAANDALHKQAFYRADGGTEIGLDMLRQNINCISGFGLNSFKIAGGGDGAIAFDPARDDGTPADRSKTLNFWINNNNEDGARAASDTNRDLYYPASYAAGQPHTNVRLNGRSVKGEGEAVRGFSGSEGLGTNIAQATGSGLLFDINAQYAGVRNNVSSICTQYLVDSQFAKSPSGKCLY